MEYKQLTKKNPNKHRMAKRIILIFLVFVTVVFVAVSVMADNGVESVYYSTVIKEGSMRMIAHRGYSSVAPENTLPAYIAAGKSDFWGAECDIHRTKDGVWILMHDNTVDRTTDGTGSPSDMTYEEISKLTVDEGNNIEKYPNTKVPTLEEYLDVCKQYGLHPIIEIKDSADTATMPELAKLLLSREEKDMLNIISFSREICAVIKKEMPETPVYLLVDKKGQQEDIDFAVDNHLDGLDIHVRSSGSYVSRVQEAGLDVFVWTVDDINNAEKCYKRGVTAVTTNCLTQEKPQLTKWQEFIWTIKDLFCIV